MLQISSGIIRGLRLKSPNSNLVRPTSERTRQAIFNILRNYRFDNAGDVNPILVNSTIADIFAGTGAFGFDAISNGASEVLFIENSRDSLRIIDANAQLVNKALMSQEINDRSWRVIASDVTKGYEKLESVRLIFCDPPYRKDYFKILIDLESRFSRLEKNGLFLFEEASDIKLDLELSNAAQLRCFDKKIYGDSTVYFFVKF